ncbi:MAG: hypothetical protein ACT4P3_01885 [Betaproteobacteria bacterium]
MNDAALEIAEVTRRFLSLFAANDVAGLAACYSEDAQMMPANMAPVLRWWTRGRYFVPWKRAAGEWRIHRDMFGTSLPRTAVRGAALSA